VSGRDARPGGAGALGAALTEQERAIGRLTVEKATLEREVERLRAIEASATTLRARVRAWATVPFRGPGYEEEYDLANNVAGRGGGRWAMVYLPELRGRMRRETEAGLRERLAQAEATIARLVPVVQRQDAYIRGSLPSLPREWAERERLLVAFNALRDAAILGELALPDE
jgi:hypothetical protein